MLNGILIVLATVSVLLWIYLHFTYKDAFGSIMAGFNKEDYPMSELFYIGFGFMKIVNYDMGKKRAKNRIKEISEVYGKKYAAFYYYVLIGAQFTYALTFVPLVFLLALLSGETLALLGGGAIVFLLIWYLDELVNDKIMARHDELLRDYPQMLSKLTLLVNAGMPIREAWSKVAVSNDGILYKEMQTTKVELENGIAEIECYKAFGERCVIKPLKKFSSMMIQNLQKGSSEVVGFLRDMSDEAWEEKKHMAKRKGEVASAKLMLPIGLIFVGVLLMIVVPMFGALSV